MTHPDMIAIVALAPSEVSYYDNKTGIRLNAANRYAPIFKDMDITNIRRSVKVGRLMLVNGVLPGEQKQGVLGKILKSSSYDMVAPGIVTEEAVNKALEEKTPDFDVDAALKEAEQNAKEAAKEEKTVEKVTEPTEETKQEKVEESTEASEEESEETEDTAEESEDKEEASKKASKKKASTKKTTKK